MALCRVDGMFSLLLLCGWFPLSSDGFVDAECPTIFKVKQQNTSRVFRHKSLDDIDLVVPCVNENVAYLHTRSCLWVAHPLGGGRVDGLVVSGKNLHQVVLRGRAVGQCSRVNGMGIVLNGCTLREDLEEYHAEFGW